MRTCHEKYGDLASMACTIGEPCELYNDPYHCQAFRKYVFDQRKLKLASDSKQSKLPASE